MDYLITSIDSLISSWIPENVKEHKQFFLIAVTVCLLVTGYIITEKLVTMLFRVLTIILYKLFRIAWRLAVIFIIYAWVKSYINDSEMKIIPEPISNGITDIYSGLIGWMGYVEWTNKASYLMNGMYSIYGRVFG